MQRWNMIGEMNNTTRVIRFEVPNAYFFEQPTYDEFNLELESSKTSTSNKSKKLEAIEEESDKEEYNHESQWTEDISQEITKTHLDHLKREAQKRREENNATAKAMFKGNTLKPKEGRKFRIK